MAKHHGLTNPDMYFIEICPTRGSWLSGDVMVTRNTKISELMKWELDPDQLVLLPWNGTVAWQIWPSESFIPLLRRKKN